jgi:hypothetical protein
MMQTDTDFADDTLVGAATRAAKPAERVRAPSRRARVLRWLRQIHLYVGLWGAVLGMLFGMTGVLLNHRAILKIPVEKTIVRAMQMQAPQEGFKSPQHMAQWLQQELRFTPVSPPVVRTQPSQKLVLSDRELVQPERWNVSLTRPANAINAEYFVGNQSIKIENVDATLLGSLTRLHMSVGVNAFWVILADTIAGSLILLSLTGLLLWTQLHTVRLVALAVSTGALVIGAVILLSM